MTPLRSLRLDDQGRVTGVATGPPRDGWVLAPAGHRDVTLLRQDAHGRWHKLTDAERIQREEDHHPAPAEHPRVARLRALKGKKQLTNDELHQAVLDLIEEV